MDTRGSEAESSLRRRRSNIGEAPTLNVDSASSARNADKPQSWTSSRHVGSHPETSTILLSPIAAEMDKPSSGQRSHYFCEGCQQARNSENFEARVTNLCRGIRCSLVWCDHPSIWFSATQRDAPQKERFCILREGRVKLCDHLSYSVADIKKICGSDELSGKGTIYHCEDQSHQGSPAYGDYPFKIGVPSIMFKRASMGVIDLCITFALARPLESTGSSTSERDIKSCLSSVSEAISKSSFAFCPHFRTTPDRMLDFGWYREKVGQPGEYSRKCMFCPMEIRFHLGEESRRFGKPPVVCELKFSELAGWIAPESINIPPWVGVFDPDSYGLFSDQTNKHITWCDDRRCATTFELGLYSFLLNQTNATTAAETATNLEKVYSLYSEPRIREFHASSGNPKRLPKRDAEAASARSKEKDRIP